MRDDVNSIQRNVDTKSTMTTMRTLNLILVSLLTILIRKGNSYTQENAKNLTRTKWAWIPDEKGKLYRINVTRMEEDYAKCRKTDMKVKFYVVTRQYPGNGRRLQVGDLQSFKDSKFDPQLPTRIILHGWTGSIHSCINEILSETYLNLGEYNMINVDWSDIGGTINYYIARKSMGLAARKISSMIDFLHSQGTALHNIYLIGHSLGAHLCGVTARRVKSGRLGAIIALDPASPLFTTKSPDRVRTSDAEYVQSVHSAGGFAGFHKPTGHASFYPNWGLWPQPDCGMDLVGTCAHRRAVTYFADSLRNPKDFVSKKCKGYREILSKNCSSNGGMTGYLGGEPLQTSSRGIFYIEPNSSLEFSGRNIIKECGAAVRLPRKKKMI